MLTTSDRLFTHQDLAVFDVLQTPVWIFDIENTRMWWANRAALKLWDAKSEKEFLNRDWSDISESTRIRLQAYLKQFHQGKTVTEQWTFYPGGRAQSVKCLFSGIRIESGRMAMLSEGIALEKESIDSASLRAIEVLRHADVIISLYSFEGKPLMQNPAAIRCYGDEKSNSLEVDNAFLQHFLNPQQAERVMGCLLEGQVFNDEILANTQNGIRWHGMVARRTNDPTTGAPMILLQEKDLTDLKQAEERLRHLNEELEIRVQERTVELKEAIAQLQAEISERQHIEDALRQSEAQLREKATEIQQTLHKLQSTHTQLIQSEKMSSLGQLVAGIAHEINNPVNFIHGNLEHADNYLQDLLELVQLYHKQYPHPSDEIQEKHEQVDVDFLAEDLPKLLSSLRMGTERIRELVVSLRNFSRLDEAEIKAVDLHEGLESTLLILGNRLKQGIEIIRDYSDLPLIQCYPAQLNQVFMNVINNAIDALMEQNEVREKQIRIETRSLSPEQIQVIIQDNGSGIPDELIEKIFDPFFTTKPVGQGTGLGLSICYQIVEKHGGRIEVKSEKGKGTQIAISFAGGVPIALPIQQSSKMLTN